MDIVSRALTPVRIFFPYLPPCELNSAVFNARERDRRESCLCQKSSLEQFSRCIISPAFESVIDQARVNQRVRELQAYL